jgi:hypothetical protein
MADIVIANDPITGQGSNTAAKCASAYLDAIVSRGDQPFDETWMHDTFEAFWTATAVQSLSGPTDAATSPSARTTRPRCCRRQHRRGPTLRQRVLRPQRLRQVVHDPEAVEAYLDRL